jgi:hypothetical protein
VGASRNVFTGKVVKQIGNKETEIGPRTQYSVVVIDSIKGELKGTVTVDMFGGYTPEGQLVVVEENDPQDFFLQKGYVYVFATRYNEKEDWYTLIAHPNARKVFSEDANLSIVDARAIGESDEKVRRWKQSYVDEILD